MPHLLKPNHLAQMIDHQKSAAHTLPDSLTTHLLKLQQLTLEIKTIFDDCLPQEVLDTLTVGKYKDSHLVLVVNSQTAANHMRYQSNNLISILSKQSITFSQLKTIDVIVSHSTLEHHMNSHYSSTSNPKKSNDLVSNNNKGFKTYGLTESTKETIAHTIEHVIKGERLKTSLKKLLKP